MNNTVLYKKVKDYSITFNPFTRDIPEFKTLISILLDCSKQVNRLKADEKESFQISIQSQLDCLVSSIEYYYEKNGYRKSRYKLIIDLIKKYVLMAINGGFANSNEDMSSHYYFIIAEALRDFICKNRVPLVSKKQQINKDFNNFRMNCPNEYHKCAVIYQTLIVYCLYV